MTTNYKKAKDDVLTAYSMFLPIIEEVKAGKPTTYDTSLAALATQAKNIKEDKFLLMIVGEAKSGKSTFINAYLGEEILPMDVMQCTSAIVEIRCGDKFRLKVTYADDRIEMIENEQKIKAFLAANAAIDDNYRDIPVSTINIEILMNKKDKKILESEIVDLLKGVENENIRNLSKDEYERRIRKYIAEKQPVWRDIVKKIEIEYPFADADLKGIEIIDTPGVNADGRVGDITNKYIEEANAVMFLKPITGSALEASSFRKFLKSKSADRNKNAMFFILTRRANETEDNIARIHDEALRQIPNIHPEQIISVDSKAEMFYKMAQKMTSEELEAHIMELKKNKKLDSFINLAWLESCRNRDEFLCYLKELSNFNVVDDALNRFAHKAQYIALSEFLGRMQSVMEKVMSTLEENIGLYKEKAADPIELANRMNRVKGELELLTQKIQITVNKVADKYIKTDGVIQQKAKNVVDQYKSEINEIDPNSSDNVDELERITFRTIEIIAQFEDKLQKEIVAECDQHLIELSDRALIKFSTLQPDLTEELFDEIKETIRSSDATQESYDYTTGACFKKIRTKIRFSQNKYFNAVKAHVDGEIEKIKGNAVLDLSRFVIETTAAYSNELAKNAKIKNDEFNAIVRAKQTADEIQADIKRLEALLVSLYSQCERTKGLKGGIDKYV